MTAVYQNYITEKQLSWWQLFFCLLQRQASAEKIEQLLSGADDEPDWDRLVSLASRHQVLTVLYVNLRKLGLWERLPGKTQEVMRSYYFQVAAKNMRLRSKLVEVIDVLERQNIPVVPFKGPVLSQILYDDSAMRHSSDLDILVPRTEAERARETLLAQGFRPAKISLTQDQFKRCLRFDKEFDFIDETGQVAVDLHWRLTSSALYPFDYAFCRERLKTMRWHDRSLTCLSDEDMVVYLCLHGSYDLWASFGAVLWVAEYIARRPELDWQVAEALATALHGRRRLLAGLFLARDLFSVDLPDRLVRLIEDDRAVARLAGGIYDRLFEEAANGDASFHIEKRFAQIPYYVKMHERFFDKVLYLLAMAFRPGKREWLLLPLPGNLFFLYFVFRPLRMAGDMIAAKVRRLF